MLGPVRQEVERRTVWLNSKTALACERALKRRSRAWGRGRKGGKAEMSGCRRLTSSLKGIRASVDVHNSRQSRQLRTGYQESRMTASKEAVLVVVSGKLATKVRAKTSGCRPESWPVRWQPLVLAQFASIRCLHALRSVIHSFFLERAHSEHRQSPSCQSPRGSGHSRSFFLHRISNRARRLSFASNFIPSRAYCYDREIPPL